MDPATKDYIDARDDATESRSAADMREIRTRMDSIEKIMQVNHEANHRLFRSFERRLDNVEHAMIAMRKTVIITGISATLSTVFGVAAFNAALLSNMQNSFDSGRFFSAAQMEVMQRMKETEVLSKQAQAAGRDAQAASRDAQAAAEEMKETARRANEALEKLAARIDALGRHEKWQPKK